MKGELLPVEQRHRDAVIAYLRAHHYASADWIERGDHHPLVDAFANFERDHLSDLTAQLDKAREALRPFAEALEQWGDDTGQPDRWNTWEHPIAMNVTLGDFRRAAKVFPDIGITITPSARACLPATSGDDNGQ